MLYYVGLIIVIIFILMGIDDFIWDVVSLIQSFFRVDGNKDLDLDAVFNEPQKMMAIMIAAWHEDNVIEDVIRHFINTTIYKRSMYHVFVGVYPNDLETIEAVRRLELEFKNVHAIINELDGPTTKAQNLNYVVSQIMAFEKVHKVEFKSFTVHDSEDVIHPFELRMTNYIMTKYSAVQFPVFPLIEYPRFGNFFKNITSNTYADEFAEHHYLTMVHRNDSQAFVPSAGTGFAIRRDVMESFEDYAFLPTDSLTEDYKLAYELYRKGVHMHYVLDKVPHITNDFKMKNSYVATRSMFPRTFKTAVRQKKRWITGITMQSVHFSDVFKKSDLSWAGRYSLYRDQKAKVGNLIAFIGYPVFVYFVVSLFVDLPVIYPKYSLSWYLSLVVTILMIERLIFRSISIFKVYGLKSVFFSTFFPPLIPIRYVWGNLINFTATIQAMKERYKNPEKKHKKEKRVKKKPLQWDKTEHHFLEASVLKNYYLRLGDILLKRNYITQKKLKRAFRSIQKQGYKGPLGQFLVKEQYVDESALLTSLSDLTESVFVSNEIVINNASIDGLKGYRIEDLEAYGVLPLFDRQGCTFILSSYDFSLDQKKRFEALYPEKTFCWHYATKREIEMSLKYGPTLPYRSDSYAFGYAMLDYEYLDSIQFMIALDYSVNAGISFKDALLNLGLLNRIVL